ncbi:hypothetical protein VI06_20720 [Aquitalea magnusonii]|nr:hypothetical protein VI06_20720 [Aquitalea magnusonii]
MTKMTAQESVNTEDRTQAKSQFESVTDSAGRTIKLRTLDSVQNARLILAVGAEAAANDVYMNAFAIPAAMVAAIDDAPLGLPQNLIQVENVLKELGNEGMAAINRYLYLKVEEVKKRISAAMNAEELAAKN